MCYSIMVETDLKKMAENHQGFIELDGLFSLLQDPSMSGISQKISFKLISAFTERTSDLNASSHDHLLAFECKKLWDADLKKIIETKKISIQKQEEKIQVLEAKLKQKTTKTTLTSLETAKRVHAKLHQDISSFEQQQKKQNNDYTNIFQYHWAPLITSLNHNINPKIQEQSNLKGAESGFKNKISLFRYQVRPHDSFEEAPSKINMFNARLDSLKLRKTWASLFMKRHGAIKLGGFYEWVPDPITKKPRVILFHEPRNHSFWVPALHDTWVSPEKTLDDSRSHLGKSPIKSKIDSFAIITKDPPPEVMDRGHDRCPVLLAEEDLDTWLNPRDESEIMELLNKKNPFELSSRWAFNSAAR